MYIGALQIKKSKVFFSPIRIHVHLFRGAVHPHRELEKVKMRGVGQSLPPPQHCCPPAPDNPLLWRLAGRRFGSLPWPLPTGEASSALSHPLPLVTTQKSCRHCHVFPEGAGAGGITPGGKPRMLLNTD